MALFGRKINAAEDQLSFVLYLKMVADDQMLPAEAVRAYHGALDVLGIQPRCSLSEDLEATPTSVCYEGS